MNDSTRNLDDLMDRYCFGLLDEPESDRVRRRIESDPEWQLAYEAAVERKRALVRAVRTENREWAFDEAAEARRALRAAFLADDSFRLRKRIIQGARIAMAAAALLMIAAWIYPGTVKPPRQMVRLVGQSEVLAGTTASFRVFVRDLSGDSVADAPVDLTLYPEAGRKPVVLASWTTDVSGSAAGQVEIPRWNDGQYILVARASGGSSRSHFRI